MGIKKITDDEFTRIVEMAINSGNAKDVLFLISTDLNRFVENSEIPLPDPYSEREFESFVKAIVDRHGDHFTGQEGFKIARDWIRNSNKTENFKPDPK